MRMWLFPYLTWATIALISFVLVYMLTDRRDGREQVLLSLLVAAVVVVIALVRDARQPKAAAEAPGQAPGQAPGTLQDAAPAGPAEVEVTDRT